MNLLPLLMKKLIEMRIFVRGTKDVNKHPASVVRSQLEGFLRVTQAELLEAFGVKKPSKLTLTLRKAIAVVARVNKGVDSYKTIGEKAEVLIKRLHPMYVAQLERMTLESSRKAKRDALEKRFTALSGKAFPDGLSTPALTDLVSEMRGELKKKAQGLMDEVNESALRVRSLDTISDVNLVAFAARLEKRLQTLRDVQPVKYTTFAEKFDRRNTVMQ